MYFYQIIGIAKQKKVLYKVFIPFIFKNKY